MARRSAHLPTGLTVSYDYDGAGRRASRTAGGATTGYLYDGLNTVQQHFGSTVTANLLTGGVDEVFARDSRSLLTDALGSTIASADTSTVAAEYTYDPFGGTTVTGDDQGNSTRFTGREDEGDGLYYYRNRFYSTSQQRFLSRDPVGLASGDTNPYAYVFNQPTGLVDPMGTKPQGSGNGVSNFSQSLSEFRNSNGPLWGAGGRFATNPNTRPRPAWNGMHGNSLNSTRPTVLYQLTDAATGAHSEWASQASQVPWRGIRVVLCEAKPWRSSLQVVDPTWWHMSAS